jgi:hypothetical protein
MGGVIIWICYFVQFDWSRKKSIFQCFDYKSFWTLTITLLFVFYLVSRNLAGIKQRTIIFPIIQPTFSELKGWNCMADVVSLIPTWLVTRCTQYNNLWHLLVTCDKVYSIQQYVTFVSDLWQGVLNTTICDIC